MNLPSLGQRVYYRSYGTPHGEYSAELRAAVVTDVTADGAVSLCVLNPTGMFFNRDVPYAATPTPGHWSFPPRISLRDNEIE